LLRLQFEICITVAGAIREKKREKTKKTETDKGGEIESVKKKKVLLCNTASLFIFMWGFY